MSDSKGNKRDIIEIITMLLLIMVVITTSYIALKLIIEF
jgi:hypothetical protein